jgi:hypothetical protein
MATRAAAQSAGQGVASPLVQRSRMVVAGAGTGRIISAIRYQPWYLVKTLHLLADTIDRYPWAQLVDTDCAFEEVGTALEESERREVRRAGIVMP